MHHKLFLLTAISIFAIFFVSSAFAENFTGKVIGVTDGDTITVLTKDNKPIKVRMTEIDAPEKDQPFGQDSKKLLSDMIFGKVVTVNDINLDKYGRHLGSVDIGKTEINLEMVKIGAAWSYTQYSTDPKYAAAQAVARSSRLGLWALQTDQIIEPWVWRRKDKSHNTNASVEANDNQNGSNKCGSKRYCKQMTSCAEARFYLNSCGQSRLDGDNDGKPCESLCR